MIDRREARIRRTLRHLSRQRVALTLPRPANGPVWVIEMTPTRTPDTSDDLNSCLLRGWVEVLQDAVPQDQLQADGSLPAGPLGQECGPIYRLTDSGWSVVRGTHAVAVAALTVATISLAIASLSTFTIGLAAVVDFIGRIGVSAP